MRTDSREGDRKMEKGKMKDRVGEIPFDQLRLINGVGGGIVDGERPRERRRERKERKAMSEPGSVGLCY